MVEERGKGMLEEGMDRREPLQMSNDKETERERNYRCQMIKRQKGKESGEQMS